MCTHAQVYGLDSFLEFWSFGVFGQRGDARKCLPLFGLCISPLAFFFWSFSLYFFIFHSLSEYLLFFSLGLLGAFSLQRVL